MNVGAALQWFDPELRDLLRVLLFALLLSLVTVYGFRRNAPAKRAFVLIGAGLLLALPLLLAWLPLVLPVGVYDPVPLTIGLPLPAMLLALWLVPACLLVARTLLANAAARRRFKALPDVEHPIAQRTADEIARALGIRRAPRLKVGASACCLTVPEPLIVLPPQLLSESRGPQPSAALRAVLTHELVHARRFDDRWLLFIQLLLDWYWWMPWLRVLAQRFEQAVEESCDDRAADFFAPGHEYLSGVLAATRDRATTEPEARAAYMSAHPLVGRVLRFGRRRDYDADWPYVGGAALVALLGVLLVTGIEPVTLEKPSAVVTLQYEAPLPVLAQPNAPTSARRAQILSSHSFVSRPQLLAALRQHRLCEEHLPIYPGSALMAELEGEVEVRFRIGQDGRVVAVQLISGDRLGAFERAAIAAIKRNRYPPLHSVRHGTANTLMDPRETGPPLEVQQRFAFRLARAI